MLVHCGCWECRPLQARVDVPGLAPLLSGVPQALGSASACEFGAELVVPGDKQAVGRLEQVMAKKVKVSKMFLTEVCHMGDELSMMAQVLLIVGVAHKGVCYLRETSRKCGSLFLIIHTNTATCCTQDMQLFPLPHSSLRTPSSLLAP